MLGNARQTRVFKNKWFVRFARQEGIEDAALCEAISRAEKGLIDTDLGGGVIKQRIARPNEGKSGGFRLIVLFRSREIAFFVYGFSKNERDNIRYDELRVFKTLADQIYDYDRAALANALKCGAIVEVKCGEEVSK
ncbi:MAG: addiction module toxin RelE [Gammaproteobacteria bacterium RIFCSPLOWO2_02_FULL_56_15]|nr:MAG: addiction module toxin RelE [Gammaproteobacteria bacterium RIFCSPLOWO2_02_FULL_56_15]